MRVVLKTFRIDFRLIRTWGNGSSIWPWQLTPYPIPGSPKGNVKLTDFGFATVFFHKGQHRTLTKRCGTAPYASPEVRFGAQASDSTLTCCASTWIYTYSFAVCPIVQVHREHYEGPDADLWSCQIVLVTMLAGCA